MCSYSLLRSLLFQPCDIWNPVVYKTEGFTDQYCHLVVTWSHIMPWGECVIEGVTLSDWSRKPLGVLIWNSTRDNFSVTHVVHLHELGEAGQLIEKFWGTFQQMCCQRLFLSTPWKHVTLLKHTACTASVSSFCTICGFYVIPCLANEPFNSVRACLIHVPAC